jgi:hypothetical protein
VKWFDIKTLKDKKVFGVPVLYLALLVVVVLAYFAWKLKPFREDPVTPDDATGDDEAAQDAANADYSSLATNGTVTVSQQGSPDITTPVVVATNERWLSNGVNFLTSKGLATGGDAQEALQMYLNGDQLSYKQGQLRDAVIAQYGLPPEQISTGGTSAKPAQRNGNPPTTHTVSVPGSDDTYPRLAQLYYGKSDTAATNLIVGANRGIPIGGSLPVGTKVKIPAWTAPKWYTTTSSMTATDIAKKNGISTPQVEHLNPALGFPVPKGTRVRVG